MATTTKTTSALTKQAVSIPLTGGIDRKTDSHQIASGMLYTAENVVYTSEKQLKKRNGWTQIQTPGSLQGVPFSAVGCRDNIEPIVLGSGALNRINTQTGLSTYLPAETNGQLSTQVVASSSGLSAKPAVPTNASCATDGQKYTLVTWYEPQGATANCFWGVQDLQTGAWVISPQVLNPTVTMPPDHGQTTLAGVSSTIPYTSNGITAPRAFYQGQYFFIAYLVNASVFFTKPDTSAGTSYTSNVSYVNNIVSVQMVSIDLLNLQKGVSPVAFNQQIFEQDMQLVYTLDPDINNSVPPIVVTGPQTNFGSPSIGWDANITNGQFTLAYIDMTGMLYWPSMPYRAYHPGTFAYSKFQTSSLYTIMTAYSVVGTTFTQTATIRLNGSFPWSPYKIPSLGTDVIYNINQDPPFYARVCLDSSGPSKTPHCVVTNGNMYILDAQFNTVALYNSPALKNVAPDVPQLTAALWSGSQAFGFIPWVTAIGDSVIRVAQYSSSANTISTVTDVAPPASTTDTGILSRPFVYGGNVFFWLFAPGYAGAETYRAQVLAEVTSDGAVKYVARCGYQSAGFAGLGDQVTPCEVLQLPQTQQFVTYLTHTTEVSTTPESAYGQITRTVFDFGSTPAASIYNLPSGGCFVAGALPRLYDGTSYTEAGFTAAPEFTSSPGAQKLYTTDVPYVGAPNQLPIVANRPNAMVTTGGSMAYGDYYYQTCFVRRDAYGNVLRSAMSNTIKVTLADIALPGSVTAKPNSVQFPPVNYFNDTNVSVEYYRSTVATPSVLYFVGKVPCGKIYVDTAADSALAGQPNPYTFSGEYPNDPPPAVYDMAIGETRAYIIPADARNTIWCSKKYSPGRSVEWTTNLILSEGGTNSGEFTAIAVLDTYVIVFKADQIIYFSGDGPDNTGASGSFTAFQRMSSDVGCIDPGSLAIIPQGLLFRSRRGIELLTRGLQVQYIGFPIEPIAQSITTIASAVVMPNYQQVRFVPSAQGEPVLVYDYLANRWSTFSHMAAVSATNINGIYWWITADGQTVAQETPGQFSDNGAPIYLTIETPELALAGIQGWGRAYRMAVLGDAKSSHQLTIEFAYDHRPDYVDTVNYNVAMPDDMAAAQVAFPAGVTLTPDTGTNTAVTIVPPGGPEQFRLSRMPRQRMQSLRVKITDSSLNLLAPGTEASTYTLPFGESCAISNLTLEYGQKAATAKLGPTGTV